MNENLEKLKNLFIDVFLITPEEFNLELNRKEMDTWDSLAVVSLAVGIQDTFGYHPTPEEAVKIASVKDVIGLLETKGISFH